jgi:C-terminal processing protease CtpA/Prc
MRKSHLLLLLLLPALAGCVPNVYRQYYVDNLGGKPVASNPVLLVPGEPAKVFRGGADVRADNQAMIENGFVQIGYSEFSNGDTTPADSEKQVRSLAKEKQAAVVLLYSKFTGTVTEQVPYTVDNPTISTSVRTDAQGNERTHTERTDNYTTVTNTVDVNRFDYTATFWVKAKPMAFGAYVRDLTPAERTALQRNTGVVVLTVIKGSPAFIGNVFPGDTLFTLGGQVIVDSAALRATVNAQAGKSVELLGLRAGKPLTLTATLGAASQ